MYKCNECSMEFKNKISLSNHKRIHTKIDNSKLRKDIINDYVNNYLTYKELNKKYGISYGTLSKFLKGVEVNKNEKRIRRKKEFKHTDDTKKLISDSRKKWLKDNPEKHVWKRSNKFKSEPCEYFKKILNENGFNYIDEFNPITGHSYSIDIAFPNIKIGIEINGNQHYNSDCSLKEYYLNIKINIEREGWKLYDIHYSKVYDEIFMKNFIIKLNENNLKDVDLSFYIKKKKIKIHYYDNKAVSLIEKIKNSNIDFSKFGWVKKVSKIVGIHEGKGGWWMKRYMNDFYEEKCKKRFVTYKNENDYYLEPKFCLFCNKVMPFDKRDQKFDSKSCASSFNNKLK